MLINFKKSEKFAQSSGKEKETSNVEIELWNLNKNKMIKIFPDIEKEDKT